MAKHFSSGVRTEDLRRQFSATTGLANQCFYNNFKYLREWAWIVGDGGREQLWFLNPAAPWKASPSTVDEDGGTEAERLERAKQKATRLEVLTDAQAGKIEELEGQVESLRDWANGSNSRAVGNLIAIVSDASASPRQRLKAAGVLVNYKVQDPAVHEFAKAFLEHLSASAENFDTRIEASEILRRCEDAMLRPSIEKIVPPSPPATERLRKQSVRLSI
jgi:hypothetical protein